MHSRQHPTRQYAKRIDVSCLNNRSGAVGLGWPYIARHDTLGMLAAALAARPDAEREGGIQILAGH